MKSICILLGALALSSCAQHKTTPTQTMIEITSETEKLELTVGEEVFYKGKIHGSVGIKVKVEIENTELIELSKTKVKYRNENRENKPGSDSAIKTFTFKALKTGSTKIIIRKNFRGQLKNEQVISCVVN